jgi:cyclopropane-fatty-acyl-phospholipid synthase
MWEYYLAGCEVAFRYCGLMVFQIQLAKSLQAVPLTRDYIVTREAELKSNEAQGPGLMVAAE